MSFDAYEDDEHDPGAMVQFLAQEELSQPARALRQFFKAPKLITEKGDTATNVQNSRYKRTYRVWDRSDITEMFSLFERCRRDGLHLNYLERQFTDTREKSGIMLDFDIFQPLSASQITPATYSNLTGYLSRILHSMIDTNRMLAMHGTKRVQYHVFYIRRARISQVESDATYKDGFHILVPELWISKSAKLHLVRELKAVAADIFEDITLAKPEVLDPGSAYVPVHFYGHSKVSGTPHRLEYVQRVEYNPRSNVSTFVEIDAAVVEGCGRGSSAIPPDVNLVYELSLTFVMTPGDGWPHPIWLNKCEAPICQGIETVEREVIPATPTVYEQDELVTQGKFTYYREILTLLTPNYADQYDLWFRVLCGISSLGAEYKPLAQWFSQRSAKYDAASFEQIWRSVSSTRHARPITFASIKHWARECSGEKYDALSTRGYFGMLTRKAMANDGKIEHTTAAATMYLIFGDRFVSDIEPGTRGYSVFYEFVRPGQQMRKGEVYKWRREPRPDELYIAIGESLPQILLDLVKHFKSRLETALSNGDEVHSKYYKKLIANTLASSVRLGSHNFQSGVIAQCEIRFRRRGFIEELDRDEHIIGVGNGVLVIGENPQLITDYHEYKISRYTDVDYVPYDADNPYVKVLESAFHDIYPEQDVYEYMMMHAATGLDGRESACILTLEVGGGRNGKSFKAKMIHNTLGHQYCASGKSSLLTSPFERGEQANSAQMQMEGKRYFYFDEFGQSETLNVARLKSIVSPTYQSGRDLHQSQRNFKNICNPICLSNYDFIIMTTDHGTWRRIRYYRNKVKFCENPDPNSPWEKRVDHRFIDLYTTDSEYRRAMLSIMVHYYTKLSREYGGDIKAVVSPTIDAETEMFRHRQDMMHRFITERVVYSGGRDCRLSSIADAYSAWFAKQNRSRVPPAISEIEIQLENAAIAQFIYRDIDGLVRIRDIRVTDGDEVVVAPEVPIIHYLRHRQ